MHVHASALDFLVWVAYLILFGLTWRFLAAKWSDKPLGKAMAAIY